MKGWADERVAAPRLDLRSALVVILCFALAGIESVVPFLFHLRAARPDLLLSVVLYLALHDDVMQGAALSAVAGFFGDLGSATPPCLYTFLAVLTFVVMRVAGAALRTEGGLQSSLIAFCASIVHALVATLLVGFVLGLGFHQELPPLVWSAFGTAVAAPFVFLVMRRLDARFERHDLSARGLRGLT